MSGTRIDRTHDSVALEQHPESPFDSCVPPSAQEQRDNLKKYRQETVKKLEANRLRSRPEEQFHDEVKEEEIWLDDIIGKRDGNHLLARKRIVERWIDQGIWRNEFQFSGPSKWKHEVPNSVESKSEYEGDGNAFSLTREEKQSTELEQLKEAEVDDQEDCVRDASRPFQRFFYQIMVGHKKFLETMATPPDFKITPKDSSEDSEEGLKEYYRILGPAIKEKRSQHSPQLPTLVSDILRYKWQRRGIWDNAWGEGLPAMTTWKHERPIEECAREADMLLGTVPDSPQGANSVPSTFGSASYDDTDPDSRV
ncbi:hypothetical protein Neosp_002882 [[Neocosmospora] mangrovei]